ncbi:MAG: hypothetical protein KDC95_22075 [Planctomycetes bacterium]|nr:hypothetical protein [Planctomycetota bacterium]
MLALIALTVTFAATPIAPLVQDTTAAIPAAETLADEAFKAAQAIEPGDGRRGDVYLGVANALIEVGRRDDALTMMRRAVPYVRQAGATLVFETLAPTYARLHSSEETFQWLGTIRDREQDAAAAQAIVRAAIARKDQPAVRTALPLLASRHYHGWDPSNDAIMVVGWRFVGDEKQAGAWTNSIVGRRLYPGEERRFASAFTIVIEDRIQNRDVVEAERLFGELEKKLPTSDTLDPLRTNLVRAQLARSDVDAARKWASAVKTRLWRTVVHGHLAVHLFAAGKNEDAASELERARELAGGGAFTSNQLVMELARAGLDEQVASICDPLLAGIDESTRTSDLRHLGGTAALAGRDSLLRAIEARLPDGDRRQLASRCATYFDWSENVGGLAALLDRLEDETVVASALSRVIARREPPRSARFEARLRALAVDRTRSLKSARLRASLLARIVNLGWAKKR